MVFLYWDLWSDKPSWTGVGFGRSLLSVAGNVVARGCRHPLLSKSGGLLLLALFCWCCGVFTNLVELASRHEVSQLTDVEKQQLQPNATVFSFSGLLSLSIVALEEEGVQAHV